MGPVINYVTHLGGRGVAIEEEFHRIGLLSIQTEKYEIWRKTDCIFSYKKYANSLTNNNT